MELKERVALVTAAGSGNGRAGAMAMAREGAHVVVTDLLRDRAEAVAAEIAARGGRAEPGAIDGEGEGAHLGRRQLGQPRD